jgi:hypothetical protein
MRVSAFIPKEKFSQFHEVLCATNGRYLENPIDCSDTIHVVYEPGPDTESRWNLYNEDIVEIRKDQWWRILSRKLGLIRNSN